jgi:hypothetical protein
VACASVPIWEGSCSGQVRGCRPLGLLLTAANTPTLPLSHFYASDQIGSEMAGPPRVTPRPPGCLPAPGCPLRTASPTPTPAAGARALAGAATRLQGIRLQLGTVATGRHDHGLAPLHPPSTHRAQQGRAGQGSEPSYHTPLAWHPMPPGAGHNPAVISAVAQQYTPCGGTAHASKHCVLVCLLWRRSVLVGWGTVGQEGKS